MGKVIVERADITKEEGQRRVDRFNYLMGLALKEYIKNGVDLTPLEKRNEMSFHDWCNYVREYKANKNNQ